MSEINERGLEELLNSREYKRHLEQLGFRVLARAVPKTGVDTGLLRNSMDSAVVKGDRSLELHLGSNVSRTTQGPVEYAVHHWAPGRPGGRRAGWPGTRPWTRSLRELGIRYTRKGSFDV